MKELIHVLYVDDDPPLLEIGRLFLEHTGKFRVTTLDSALSALDALDKESFDVILSDYQMPVMDGIEFLKIVRGSKNNIPFILFTGRGREEVVIQALNEGADFYLQKGGDVKSQFTELSHKIQQAVRQRRLETSIRNHERLEADVINFLPDATFAINTEGIVITWNRAMEMLSGIKAIDMIGKGNYEYSIPFYHERRPMLIDLVLRDDPVTSTRYESIKRDGDLLSSEITLPYFHNGAGASFWFTASPLYDNLGEIIGSIESIREITEQKKAEEALKLDESRLEAMLRLNLMIGESEHEITDFALSEAVRLTESAIGYIAFVNEDESILTMYAWSRQAMQNCRIQDKPLLYPLDNTGLWGEPVRQRRPVITNEYDAYSPLKKGTPEGHVPLVRHLGVPIYDNKQIVIVAGVGNKSTPYGSSDIRQIELLMGGLWTILQRKQAESTLRRNNEELQAAYEEISATEEELRVNYQELLHKEDELEKSRYILQTMANNLPGVVYRVCVHSDGTYRFDYISDRCLQILGIRNDVTTFFRQVSEGIPDEDRERFLGSIRQAVDTRTMWNYEGRFTKPSGETIWVKVISSPLEEDSEFIFDGVILDDTVRKRENELLALLVQIADHASISITAHDTDGNMLYANEPTFRIHGYTKGEFLSRNLHELDVPESEQLTTERINEIREKGEIEFDVSHYHKDGSIIPLHVHTKLIEWYGKEVILSFARIPE